MIHTNLPRNCMGFLSLCDLTRSAIHCSRETWLLGRPCLSTRLKENHAISRRVCVDHCILLLPHLSPHMHFIINGYKRFSKTSTDSRKRVRGFAPFFHIKGSKSDNCTHPWKWIDCFHGFFHWVVVRQRMAVLMMALWVTGSLYTSIDEYKNILAFGLLLTQNNPWR